MSSLSNYLLTNRKRLGLSQEEVAFLLGMNGLNKGTNISRHESYSRIPDLQTAFAYEVIYKKPIRELFAGLYEEAEQNVIQRARVLSHRAQESASSKSQEVIIGLIPKPTV